MTPLRVLVLAGTGEARNLAARLAGDDRFDATASLAGETRDPAPFACPLRIGGFGGFEGLARHLAEQRIEAVVDATHPFARYPAIVERCCRALGLPRLRLVRPLWHPQVGETWIEVADFNAAAAALPEGARALLTTGRKSRGAFEACAASWLGLRVVDPPTNGSRHPAVFHIVGRPPFTFEEECALFREHGVTHLVTRNSGGSAGRTKLDAAASMGIGVVMIARPASTTSSSVRTVDEALAWLARLARERDDARAGP